MADLAERRVPSAPVSEGLSTGPGLEPPLRALEQRVPDLRGVVLATRDGLAVASTMPGESTERVAAMAASVVALADQVMGDPAAAGRSTTIVRGAAGCLFVHPAGSGTVLAARSAAAPNLGLVSVELPATVAALEAAGAAGAAGTTGSATGIATSDGIGG